MDFVQNQLKYKAKPPSLIINQLAKHIISQNRLKSHINPPGRSTNITLAAPAKTSFDSF